MNAVAPVPRSSGGLQVASQDPQYRMEYTQTAQVWTDLPGHILQQLADSSLCQGVPTIQVVEPHTVRRTKDGDTYRTRDAIWAQQDHLVQIMGRQDLHKRADGRYEPNGDWLGTVRVSRLADQQVTQHQWGAEGGAGTGLSVQQIADAPHRLLHPGLVAKMAPGHQSWARCYNWDDGRLLESLMFLDVQGDRLVAIGANRDAPSEHHRHSTPWVADMLTASIVQRQEWPIQPPQSRLARMLRRSTPARPTAIESGQDRRALGR